MLKEQNNQLQTDCLHIIRLQEESNKLSVTHEQHRYLLKKNEKVKNKQLQSLQCIHIMMGFSTST